VKQAGFDYAASVTPINIDNHPVEAVRFHNLEWFAKGAIDFLEETALQDEPFFLIVNLTTHHGPCHIPSIEQPVSLTPAGHVEGLEGIMPERNSIFSRIEEKGYHVDFRTAGSVWTDDCVKAILDQLTSTGKSDETLVVFTTDHNRYDGKATCYEGGVKIPFFARYPGAIEAGRELQTRFQLTDMLPTLLEAGGIPLPEDLNVDGRSIWPQLTGESNTEVHEDLFFEFGYSRGVLAGDWKYIAIRFPEELTDKMKNGETNRAFALRGSITDEPCFNR
jgi:arylsulfatase A-like enzyme